VGSLLDQCAGQQALLDAWADTRRRPFPGSRDAEEVAEFERHAARRLSEISDGIRNGTWRPGSVRPAKLPKPDGTTRPLGIPPIADRVVERAILRVLEPVVDPLLLPWSFGFRRGVGTHDALRCLVDERDDGCRFVERGDLADCFGSIPRRRLVDRLAGVVDDQEFIALVSLLVDRDGPGDRRGH
jgi:CRISPR-associated protein Cas1